MRNAAGTNRSKVADAPGRVYRPWKRGGAQLAATQPEGGARLATAHPERDKSRQDHHLGRWRSPWSERRAARTSARWCMGELRNTPHPESNAEPPMRQTIRDQLTLGPPPRVLHFPKAREYEEISAILDECPEAVELVLTDLLAGGVDPAVGRIGIIRAGPQGEDRQAARGLQLRGSRLPGRGERDLSDVLQARGLGVVVPLDPSPESLPSRGTLPGEDQSTRSRRRGA